MTDPTPVVPAGWPGATLSCISQRDWISLFNAAMKVGNYPHNTVAAYWSDFRAFTQYAAHIPPLYDVVGQSHPVLGHYLYEPKVLAESLPDWMAGQADKKPSTLARYKASMKFWFKLVGVPALEGYRVQTDPNQFSPSVPGGMQTLLDAYQRVKELGHKQEQYVLLVVGLCGLRISEALALNRASFGAGFSEITIIGKGAKIRRVPVPAKFRADLADLAERSRAIAEFGTLSRSGGARVFSRALRRSGVVATPHRGRATYATFLYEKSGHDIVAVSRALGHASIETTKRYVASSLPDIVDSAFDTE